MEKESAMKGFVVIAYYTKDTPYEQELDGFVARCEAGRLKHHIYGLKSQGSWALNCGMKPSVIARAMEEWPDRNILYVDIDARIKNTGRVWAQFSDMDSDFAAHWLGLKNELLSGTLFFKNNERTRQLVNHWIAAQAEAPEVKDQETLASTLQTYAKLLKIKVARLPANYTRIFDRKEQEGAEPYIEHFQASRKYKGWVNTSVVIPESVGGVRVRRLDDGGILLARVNSAVIAGLAKDFVREPRSNKWYPRCSASDQTEELRSLFDGKIVNLVGKGPSLDKLDKESFAGVNILQPVVCVNDSIHAIERLGIPNPLVMIQQDAGLTRKCSPSLAATTILISYQARHWFAGDERTIIYVPSNYGLYGSSLTVLCAIGIAKKLGATGFRLFAFDGAKGGSCEYAECIGYGSKTKTQEPSRFLTHGDRIIKAAGELPLTWM
jgi:hypothetical protein